MSSLAASEIHKAGQRGAGAARHLFNNMALGAAISGGWVAAAVLGGAAATLAMLDRFAFDTVLYPINWVCWHQGNFGPAVLKRAQDKGMGVLALKALGWLQV